MDNKIPHKPIKQDDLNKNDAVVSTVAVIIIPLFFFYCIGSLMAFSFGAFNQLWDKNCDINTGGKVIFYPSYKAGCFITMPFGPNEDN